MKLLAVVTVVAIACFALLCFTSASAYTVTFSTPITPTNNSIDVNPYGSLGINITVSTGGPFNVSFYMRDSLASNYRFVGRVINVNNGTQILEIPNTNNYDNYHWYDHTYWWYAVVNGTNETGVHIENTSAVYTYDTESYEIGGCDGMDLIIFITWLGLFGLFFLVSVWANSNVFGILAGLLLIILGAFIIMQGIYIESGTVITEVGPSDTVIEKEYNELVAPSSTYGMVWGVSLILIGVFILYSNAEGWYNRPRK